MQEKKRNDGSLRGNRFSLALLTLVLVFFFSAFKLSAQMSGTYTICSSGCSFSSFSAAVSSLTTNGVNGAVTFNVSPQNYNEQVSIGSISGVSSTNTITFHGTGSTNTQTRLYYNATSNGVLKFNGASYVKFDNMLIENSYSPTTYMYTYYYTVYLTGASNCTIDNCYLKTYSGTYYYYFVNIYNINSAGGNTFSNNTISKGYYSVYNTGSSSNGNDLYKNNAIYNGRAYGFYCYYISNNTYDGNTVDSCGSYNAYSYYENGATWKNNKLGLNQLSSYGIYFAYSNAAIQTNPFQVINNLCHGNSYGIYCYNYASSASINVHFIHNTAFGNNSYGMYCYLSGPHGFDLRNNLLVANYNYAGYIYGFNSTDRLDGNNFYASTTYFVAYNGYAYSSLSAYQAAAAANGHGKHDMNMQPYFKASNDLHLDQTKDAPFGPYAGVSTDVDGDTRCTIFPTAGGDEVSGGSKNATITGTKFTGPSRVYYGNPATFLNTANPADQKVYKWYINNKFITDSFHMTSTAFTGPTDVVKLVAINCGSKDSFTMNVTVDTPKAKPVADFIADKNSILQGDRVKLTDLSSNYPSSWQWSFSPDSTFDQNGKRIPVYTIFGGGMNKPNLDVRFDFPGKYKVCLTTSNLRGTSAPECKVDYIEVIPAYVMGQTTRATAPRGYIYDNGGPNGNYKGGYRQIDKMLIDACADSVYLVFNYFDMQCGGDWMNVYEGKDNTGTNLYPKCASTQTLFGTGGYTGGPSSTYCYYSSTPGCFPKPTDTLKAKNYMYMEMGIYSAWSYRGFEAYYWTKPRSEKKPVAKFTSADSICSNGTLSFTNETVGTNVTYNWDLDGDMSFFESNSKNTSYPYLATGTVKVTLIATNCGGSDTFTKNITVFDPAKPVAAYTVDNPTPTTSDIVLFTSATKECVDAYTWTFTPQSGTGTATFVNGTSKASPNPQVTFSSKGCWDMTLVTSNKTGQSTTSKACVVNVRDPYCVPSVTNLLPDLGITEVQMGDIDYKSPAADAPGYHNYAPVATTRAEIGVTYNLTVTRPTNKNKVSHAVWVDWNGDGDFSDAKEYVDSEFANSSLTWTTKVTVPTIAKVGATIMRIASNQGNWSSTPCGPNNFGEFEDYRLYIGPDATAPEITLIGADTVKIEQGYTYNDSGATATDNLDGNLTSKITVTITNGNTTVSPPFNTLVAGTYVFHYNVSDAAGNPAKEVRRVIVVTPDKTAPDLIVETPDTIIVELGNSFTPPAVISANDLVDGPLDQYVTVDNPVHVDASGNVDVVDTYTVTHTVTDKNNNTAKVIRTVIVKDVTAPVLTMIGSNPTYVGVFTSYNDSGVTATDNYYTSTELAKLVVVTSNVDVNKVGTYTVVYNLTDPSGNSATAVTRTVIVRDTTAPVITMKGNANVKMRVFDDVTILVDEGATATDNYDNAVTVTKTGTFYPTVVGGKATKVGKFTIVYEATDASGNKSSVTRNVEVIDDEAPVLTLVGPPAAEVCRWKTYTDAGVTVSDNYNKGLKATLEGSVDVSKVGLYAIRYKATDSSGNTGYSDWRYVLVKTPEMCNATGIDNNGGIENFISIYPNPSNGLFTIKSNLPSDEKNVRITVTNLLGQEVAYVNNSTLGNNTTFQFDLSSQASGVYLVNIITGTQSVTKQIVLTK